MLAVFRPVSSTVFNGEETTQSEQLPAPWPSPWRFATQRFVFAMENGTTWLGLPPPDENGQSQDPITYAEVLT